MSSRGKYHKYTEEEKKEIRRLFEEESKSTREIFRLLGFPFSFVELFTYRKRGLCVFGQYSLNIRRCGHY